MLLPLMAACVSVDEPAVNPEQNGNYIGFRSDMATSRATVETLEGNTLPVWGYMRTSSTDDGAEWTQVFSAAGADGSITITKDDSDLWSYENPEFWTTGNIYTFQTFYSTNSAIKPVFDAESNSLSISGFDATQHHDLLYAAETRDYDNQRGGFMRPSSVRLFAGYRTAACL